MNATAPATTPKTITLTAQSTEFILAYANANANLPVELTDFTAYYADGNVFLTWETQSETNNQGFFVQRSTDGINFEDILFVPAAGNSNTTIQYLEKDINPLTKITYYRLNQVDFNGENTYSEIKTIRPTEELTEFLHVYPNPSDGVFNVLNKRI
jgi:hypothetical protein